MAKVNLPQQLKSTGPVNKVISEKLGPEAAAYFAERDFIQWQLWRRTGGSTDFILDNTFTVIEADADYQVLQGEDAINCDGTFDVTFPAIDSITRSMSIEVTSTNGIITVVADATLQGSEFVTNGTSSEWYNARGQWWRR